MDFNVSKNNRRKSLIKALAVAYAINIIFNRYVSISTYAAKSKKHIRSISSVTVDSKYYAGAPFLPQ